MAPKLLAKPLTATVKERVKDKKHRIAPPTALAPVYLLPKPEPTEPTAPPKAEPEPVAAKKKKGSNRYTDEFKAKVIARVLKAKESGEETVTAIATDEKVTETAIYGWLKRAREEAKGKTNGASTEVVGRKPGRLPKSDMKTLTRELADAMDRVAVLKKRLVKMLTND
jgi:transposase-like protein